MNTESKISFSFPSTENNIARHRKERHFSREFSMITFQDGEFRTPCTVRLYSTDSTTYAVVWGHLPRVKGSAKAGGGGYDKKAHAVMLAFHNAGYDIPRVPYESLGAYELCHEVFKFIAQEREITNFYTHSAHP